MKLSTQLLLGVVGITLLSQLILGFIAYRIVAEADLDQSLNHLRDRTVEIRQAMVIPLATGEAPRRVLERSVHNLAPFVETAVLVGPAGIVAVAGPEQHRSHVERLADKALQALKENREQQGEITFEGDRFFWSTVPLDELSYRLLVFDRRGGSGDSLLATLHSRFLSSSIPILWFAVWTALLLASVISRKLDQKTAALRRQMTHDPLTALPNRASLYERISDAIDGPEDFDPRIALLSLEIDRFDEINETLGHDFGDQLLLEISARIAQTLDDNALLARPGDNRFSIMVEGADETAAIELANTIMQILHEPIRISHVELEATLDIGIALYPAHATDAAALMRHADIARHQARTRGHHLLCYDDSDSRDSIRHLRLGADLRKAIKEGQLLLHYQPKLSLACGCVTGLEALVRWEHPSLGLVPPDDFIGLAEQTGAIVPLTEWVIEEALYFLRQLHVRGAPLEVAVNISTQLLHDSRLKPYIKKMLRDTGIGGRYLGLEITESVLMHDVSRAQQELEALHDMGVRIAIDDFGTGFSSLAYLNRLPVDELKVDRSFVQSMAGNTSDQAIVQSIIELAHTLECTVVAEGVENEDSLKVLEKMGCDLIQGYHLSAPLPAAAMTEWLERRGAFGDPPCPLMEESAVKRQAQDGLGGRNS